MVQLTRLFQSDLNQCIIENAGILCTNQSIIETLQYVILGSYIPGGWSFYTLVLGVANVQDHTHPREGYYITCYLGNITVEERYDMHSYMLPR